MQILITRKARELMKGDLLASVTGFVVGIEIARIEADQSKHRVLVTVSGTNEIIDFHMDTNVVVVFNSHLQKDNQV